MNKQAFAKALEQRLSGLPRPERRERISFYLEMIDDRMEEGRDEEDAVADVGTVDEIVAQILADTPLAGLVKEKIKPDRRLKTWQILLLALGSPLWLAFAIVALALLITLYAVLWSLVAAVWAVFASFAVAGPGGVMIGVLFSLGGYMPAGLATVAAGAVCAGLSIFLFFAGLAATKGAAILSRLIVLGIKKCFM